MLKYTTVFSIFLLWACTPTENSATKQVKTKPEKSIVKTHNKPTNQEQLNTKEPVQQNLTPKRLLKKEPSPLNAEKKPLKTITATYEYKNPSLSQWDAHFGNDPKWMAIYQESVDHYLLGVANNLERQSDLLITRSMLIFVYGKKMSETFLLSPEFVEFAKNKFEHSTELRTFIQTHPMRIIED
ncbi:MAG: hypothetical protein RL737_1086 [Bacteroidota bacterium]|jgi:hypothetical protein